MLECLIRMYVESEKVSTLKTFVTFSSNHVVVHFAHAQIAALGRYVVGTNWNNIHQIIMGNNLYDKPLVKSKIFPWSHFALNIGFSYLYEIFHSVTVSYDIYQRRLLQKAINPITHPGIGQLVHPRYTVKE